MLIGVGSRLFLMCWLLPCPIFSLVITLGNFQLFLSFPLSDLTYCYLYLTRFFLGFFMNSKLVLVGFIVAIT